MCAKAQAARTLEHDGANVTLFIIIISTTNIALGYGLALYLGHSKQPRRVRLPVRKRAKEQPAENTDEALGAAIPQEEEAATDSPLFPETAEQSPQESKDEPVEPPSIEAATKEESAPAESEPEQPPTAEPVEAKAEKPAATDGGAASNSADASSEAIDDSLLEGIEAFQNQLGESQPEQAEKDDSAAAEEATNASPEDSAQDSSADDAEELLAGIESFRAQLADVKGTDEPSAEGSTSEVAEDAEKAEVAS